MYFDNFMQKLNNEKFPGIVLFFGESEDIIAEGFQTLKNVFRKRYPDGDIISFDGKGHFKENNQSDLTDSNLTDVPDDLADVVVAAQSTGLFSKNQLIVLRHAEKVLGGRSEKSISLLNKYFEDPNSHSCLVFLAAGMKKDAKVVETVGQLGWSVQCSNMPEWKIGGWLRSQAFDKGLALTEEGAQLLIEKIGMDVACLKNALDQLKVYIFPKKAATEIEIRELPTPGIEPEIFAFLDAFGLRQTREALRCLQRIGDKKHSGLVHRLYQRIRELLIVSVEKSNGSTQIQLAQKMRFHPFRIQQLWKQSGEFSVADLKSALLDLVRLQAGIVTGRVSESLAGFVVQKLIVKWGRKDRAE